MNSNDELIYGLKNWQLAAIAVFLMLMSFIPIWVSHYFMTQNGSLYLLGVQIVKEFSNPAFNFNKLYDLDLVVVPNLTFLFIIYILGFMFPILTAYKIAICIEILLLPIALFYFIKAIDSRKLIWGFIIFIFVHNYFIYKGYDNFYVSFSIFLFYFGYLVRHSDNLRIKNYLALFFFTVLLYLSHIFSFLIAIFLTFVYLFLHHYNWKKILQILSTFTPTVLLFLYYISKLLIEPEAEFGGQTIMYYSITRVARDFVQMCMFSLTETPVLLFLIPLIIVSIAVVMKLISVKRQYFSKEKGFNYHDFLRAERILILLVVLGLLFLVAPRMIIGWGKFNERFLPFFLFFLIVNAEIIKSRWFNRIFISGIIILSLTNYGVLANQIHKIGKDADQYMSGLPYIKKNSNILPLHFEDYHIGNIRPLHYCFNYYTIQNGGATWKNPIFKLPGRIPIFYKNDLNISNSPLKTPLKPRRSGDADLAQIQQVYDYILIWGNATGFYEDLRRIGFKLIHQKGKMSIYYKEKS